MTPDTPNPNEIVLKAANLIEQLKRDLAAANARIATQQARIEALEVSEAVANAASQWDVEDEADTDMGALFDASDVLKAALKPWREKRASTPPAGSKFVPTRASGNFNAFVCCEGVGVHAPGCTAGSKEGVPANPFKRCQHDLNEVGTTIVVDGVYDAKCMCCLQEWHLPPIPAPSPPAQHSSDGEPTGEQRE